MAGLKIFRRLRQLKDIGSQPPWTPGDVLTVQLDGQTADFDAPVGGGGGGAPTDAGYLVTVAHAGLTAEVPVGATPQGELGGTWGAPTVDAVHSGSSHAAVQAAAEATAAAALAGHVAAADPHAGYQKESEKGAANGYASLDAGGTVPDGQIPAAIARDAEVTAAVAASEAGQVRDGDAAGGVLSGTYPNPGFAADMATQAELDAVAATIPATAADIPIVDAAGDFTATELEGALAELQADHETDAQNLADHIADASAAHAASAVSADSTTLSGTGTDVQAVLEELDNLLDDHSARHENGGLDEISVAGLSGELADAQPVTVRKNTGADVGTRSRLNFIEGSNVTLTVADDAGSDEVDITIASTGGGGATPNDVNLIVHMEVFA